MQTVSIYGFCDKDDICMMKNANKIIVLNINQENKQFAYLSTIESALTQAELEVTVLNETIDRVESLKPDCDKLDYVLAACSGALCGIIDVFCVGKPGESSLSGATDRWFENKTCSFAKLCGWKGPRGDSDYVKSAIGYLERHYKVPYDQNGILGAGREYLDLNPTNHHFKSLGHNPSLLGLFFSILNQFLNTSHFVSEGELIHIDAEGDFELRGNSFPAKIWCGFINWICHLMSDVSGCSGSKERGMGIPSPLWTWINDIIAIKANLRIPVNQFNKDVNDIAVNMFKEGFDLRFQATQAIPVFINEMLVRLFYSIRRLIRYYRSTDKNERSFKGMWTACEPFSNPTVKRMLTVAHGTFCLVDIADATIRGFATGGGFNPLEFFLRLNVAGLGRFTICLYGEARRAINIHHAEKEASFAAKERTVLEDYIDGLNILKSVYNDKEYLTFVDDLQNNNYIVAFTKTATLAHLRGVPTKDILRDKTDIDTFFNN